MLIVSHTSFGRIGDPFLHNTSGRAFGARYKRGWCISQSMKLSPERSAIRSYFSQSSGDRKFHLCRKHLVVSIARNEEVQRLVLEVDLSLNIIAPKEETVAVHIVDRETQVTVSLDYGVPNLIGFTSNKVLLVGHWGRGRRKWSAGRKAKENDRNNCAHENLREERSCGRARERSAIRCEVASGGIH